MLDCPAVRVVSIYLVFVWLFFYPDVHAQGSGSYQDHDVDLEESKHDEEFFTFVTVCTPARA